jgi:hypothetical protein
LAGSSVVALSGEAVLPTLLLRGCGKPSRVVVHGRPAVL